MKNLLPCALLPTLLLTALCTTTGLAQTTLTGSFVHDGVLRDYRLYIPAVYNAAVPAPLVLNLHGYTSNAIQQEFYGDFRPIADTAGFLVVHPNGTLDGSGARFWNTFSTSGVDDLGFLVALLDTISAQFSIDADRVYSTGMSNGGFMSYDLACYRSERFAAIASVTGTMIVPRLNGCAAVHPTPVMQVHGTADPTVPYNGGSGFVPVEDLVDHWRQYNNCDPVPTVTLMPDLDPDDGCTVEHIVYDGGDGVSSVELFKVIDGGHTWPGALFNLSVTNQDIMASVEIWRFFSRYRLSDLMTHVGTRTELSFSLGPNPSAGDFHLRFAEPGERRISVVDGLGRQLLIQQSTGTEAVVQVDVRGPLLIMVTQGAQRSIRRVVRL